MRSDEAVTAPVAARTAAVLRARPFMFGSLSGC
jgi:hypothetical protein